MGSILNPDKENSFIRLANRENKYLFVDKTDFIEKTNKRLNEDNRFFAVTRPRRFGKTVTAHMLSAYYSKGYAGQNIFDNLKITNNEFKASYEKHLNKYDVIYIDMNTIDGLFDGYSNKKQKVDGVNDLVDYFEYSIIKELKSSSEFSECLENHQIGNTGLLYGFHGAWQFAPQLWSVDYVAGVDENDKTFPTALLQEAIYKRAACGILNVWGDLILGAGIASQSVSIDGVSQSIGTTQSAMFGGASARIESYTKDINEQILPSLKMKFSGIRMVVV